MSKSTDDKLLHDYLRGDSELSRRYKSIESDEVPTELDSLVISAATQSIGTRKPTQQSNWRKWSAPLAMAATIIVTVSIVIQGNVNSPVLQTDIVADQYLKKQKELSVEQDAPEFKARAKLDAAPDEKQVADRKANLAEPKRAQIDAASSAPSQQVSDTRRDKSLTDKLDNVVVTGQYARGSVEEASVPITVTSAEDLANLAPSTAASERAKLELGSLEFKQKEKTTPANELRQRSASLPAAAPAVVTPTTQAKVASRNKDENSHLEEVIVTAAKRRGNLNDTAMAVEVIQAREADPEAWLKYIRELRFQGQLLSANSEWKRFKEAYPDFPVADNDRARSK